MRFLLAGLVFSAAAASAEVQTINCPNSDMIIRFKLTDPLEAFGLNCSNGKAECAKLRKHVKVADLMKATRLVASGPANVRLSADYTNRVEDEVESESVDLVFPVSMLGSEGTFKAQVEMCVQDCMKKIMTCRSTVDRKVVD